MVLIVELLLLALAAGVVIGLTDVVIGRCSEIHQFFTERVVMGKGLQERLSYRPVCAADVK